jgi:hypothetical protein
MPLALMSAREKCNTYTLLLPRQNEVACLEPELVGDLKNENPLVLTVCVLFCLSVSHKLGRV